MYELRKEKKRISKLGFGAMSIQIIAITRLYAEKMTMAESVLFVKLTTTAQIIRKRQSMIIRMLFIICLAAIHMVNNITSLYFNILLFYK